MLGRWVTPTLRALAVALLLVASWRADAQILRAGLVAEASTPDPHFFDGGGNNTLSGHIYDRLVVLDARQSLQPGLAVAWRALDETTWEFELRRGVRFHDGGEFTAADVVASIDRVRSVTGSPASFIQYVRPVTTVEIIDPYRVRIRTVAPFPLLPRHLALIAIVSHRYSTGDTAAFNAQVAAVGTGPYRLVRWVPNEGSELERNDVWWGERPAWERVTLRRIPRDGPRVAALLAGDVDIIDQVPPADVERLQAHPDIALHRAISARLMYILLDSARERSPFVVGLDGAQIANPLRDPRVRLALSLAVDRRALAERLLGGLATPAAGVVPRGFFGAIDDPPPDFNPERARRLLADAGWPQGFALQINGPNDRYLLDDQVMQAVAAMWTRIGVRTRVEAQPSTVAIARASRLEFSAFYYGVGAQTGEPLGILRQLVGTYDVSRGFGTINRGRYSNPAVDALIARGEVTMNDEARASILADATRLALGDVAVIALYHFINVWASRRNIVAVPRADDQFRAADVRRGN